MVDQLPLEKNKQTKKPTVVPSLLSKRESISTTKLLTLFFAALNKLSIILCRNRNSKHGPCRETHIKSNSKYNRNFQTHTTCRKQTQSAARFGSQLLMLLPDWLSLVSWLTYYKIANMEFSSNVCTFPVKI